MNILPRSFFNRPTLIVAEELLGKRLIFGYHSGIIYETEAYIGKDDEACHAAKGKTKRTEVMFGPAGFSYVYFIYGMYHCFNIVTEAKDFSAAVLIRGVQCDDGTLLDGPGKLCRHFAMDKTHNNIDITSNKAFCVHDTDITLPFTTTPRIGISKAKQHPWRFLGNL